LGHDLRDEVEHSAAAGFFVRRSTLLARLAQEDEETMVLMERNPLHQRAIH
jgi:hypothetical protein